MTSPTPFAYPPDPHRRKHGPSGYVNYEEYKPWLRDEFTFRCLYCLERETWYPNRSASFSADHVVPRKVDRSRVCDYTNLVYACTRCNSLKGTIPLLDPTKDALGAHLRVGEDGRIFGLSDAGNFLIEMLHLDKEPALGVRRYRYDIIALWGEFPDNPTVRRLFLRSFQYPEDLPDLTALRPPGGNSREEGKHDCFHARRRRGVLEDFY